MVKDLYSFELMSKKIQNVILVSHSEFKTSCKLYSVSRHSLTCRRGEVCEKAVWQSRIVDSLNNLAGKKTLYLEIQQTA